jgi:tRNA nucleotidyltransferase (CCA-adding enzyme)
MKVYEVGGAVRDALLGLPVADRDYVVVGATPDELLRLGYRPVGRDFPVFLHPQTGAEYALARTERKSGAGYRGFAVHAAPDVTLEEDLARRDLTINAMARDAAGTLIDPHGGARDLAAGVLRHVGPAFVEDPVRILRVARFAARYGFAVAEATMRLMRAMVDAGEADALVAERVWQELARGLMERRPSRMFEVLRACGALARVLPELDRLWGVPQRSEHHPEVDTGVHAMLVIDAAAARGYSLETRFAALVHDLGKGLTPPAEWPAHVGHERRGVELVDALAQRLRVPGECHRLARLAARHHGEVHRALELRPETLLGILEACDALRRPERFAGLLDACEADHRGRLGHEDRPYPQRARFETALAAARAVDAAALATEVRSRGGTPERIGARLREERIRAITSALREASAR